MTKNETAIDLEIRADPVFVEATTLRSFAAYMHSRYIDFGVGLPAKYDVVADRLSDLATLLERGAGNAARKRRRGISAE